MSYLSLCSRLNYSRLTHILLSKRVLLHVSAIVYGDSWWFVFGNMETHTHTYICILCMVGSDPKNSSNFLTSLLTFLLCGHPRGRASDAWYLTWTEKNRGTIKSCLNSGLLEFARVCLFVFPLFASSQNRVYESSEAAAIFFFLPTAGGNCPTWMVKASRACQTSLTFFLEVWFSFFLN